MSTAFYKTNDAGVLSAMEAYKAEAAEISKAGSAFADHFGGHAIMNKDVHGYRVAGVYFTPAKDDPLWTKPDAMSAGRQQPRASLRKGTKEQRAALVALLEDWKERFPHRQASFEPVLAAMGTDWGSLYICGFSMFERDGCIYASSSAKLAPVMQEILGSEYNGAKAASEAIKEAA